MDTRWRIPPESSWGRASSRPCSPTSASSSSGSACCLTCPACRPTSRGRRTLSTALRQGSSVASWKTKAKSRPAGLLRRAAEDADGAAGDRHQIRDGPQQRRLAAARRPQHGDEAALRHLEADPVQGGDAARRRVPVEADRQLPHRNGRGGGGFSDRRRRGGRRHPICFLRDSVASRIFVVMTSSTVGVSPLNCFSSA